MIFQRFSLPSEIAIKLCLRLRHRTYCREIISTSEGEAFRVAGVASSRDRRHDSGVFGRQDGVRRRSEFDFPIRPRENCLYGPMPTRD
jgi:hypothetical protein